MRESAWVAGKIVWEGDKQEAAYRGGGSRARRLCRGTKMRRGDLESVYCARLQFKEKTFKEG